MNIRTDIISKEVAGYADFAQKRLNLAKDIDRAIEIFNKINTLNILDAQKLGSYIEKLKVYSDKTKADSFKIQIVGTFKNGKSTFINSLLGEEVLPAYALPCTAVINEVKYDKDKKAILHFCEPLPERLLTNIPVATKKHMERYNYKNIPPMEIPYDEIEDYVCIPMGEKQEEYSLQSPYSKVELYYPLELLKNGIEVIDSPGLNEHKTRTQVTTQYLDQVDAVLFVLNSLSLCAADEMEFIENYLSRKGYDAPFFIVNRYDQVRVRERPAVRKYAEAKLKPLFSNDIEIFCLSALNALDGKLDLQDAKDTTAREDALEAIKESGLPAFETRLADFLVKEKGKAKLNKSVGDINAILKDMCENEIPQSRKILEIPLAKAKEKYDVTKPKLDRLLDKKNMIQKRIDNRINRLAPEVKSFVEAYFTTFEVEVTKWIDEYEFPEEIDAGADKKYVEKAINVMGECLISKIDNYQIAWFKENLPAFINDKNQLIYQDVSDDIDEVFEGLSNIKGEVADAYVKYRGEMGVSGINVDTSDSMGDILSGIGAVVGLILGGPLSILAGTFLGGVIGSLFGDDPSLKIKNKMKETMTAKIKQIRNENTENIKNDIMSCFNERSKVMMQGIEMEINAVDQQLKNIIAEREKSERIAAEKGKVLQDCETSIHAINTDMSKLAKTL